MRSEAPEKTWLLFERIARSLAHSVGNAINVVSGRLSLLELDSTLSQDSRDSVKLIRERLRRLHSDLKGALEFARFVPEGERHLLVEALTLATQQSRVRVRGLEQVAGLRTTADVATGSLSPDLALRYLRDGCLGLQPEGGCDWSVEVVGSERPTLALTMEFSCQKVPALRRALIEPWFSEEAHALEADARYARLLLAQGLALLEDGGATIVVDEPSGEEPAVARQVQIAWSLVDGES